MPWEISTRGWERKRERERKRKVHQKKEEIGKRRERDREDAKMERGRIHRVKGRERERKIECWRSR